ncbi:MAG: hypothetical protein WCV56_00855 [Candidatus Omnitrophota bacterium]
MAMTVLKKAVLIVVCVFASYGASGEAKWQDITGSIGVSEEITCIEAVNGSNVLYAGTKGGVFVSVDLGRTWVKENVRPFGPQVSGIAVARGSVFVSSEQGLFIKEEDTGSWDHVPGEGELKGARADDSSEGVITWTDDKVFVVEKGAWKEISPAPMGGRIGNVVLVSDTLYLSRGGEIIFGKLNSGEWDRMSLVSVGEDEDEQENENFENDNDDQEIMPELIRDITPMAPEGALVSTGKGIYVFTGRGDLPVKIDTTGLPADKVVTASGFEGGILAATDKKVFLRRKGSYFWTPLLEVSDAGGIKDMKVRKAAEGNEYVFLAFSRRIYIYDPGFLGGSSLEEKRMVFREDFIVGPDIREVHKMAVEYAEVSPDKIKQWREGAKWRGILPRLALKYDESYSDKVEFYKSASTTYMLEGPRDKRDGWGVTLTWDLPDLIWNSSQTSIDVRSKLMVQLRDDILEDVTRLYFERKRIIDEMAYQDRIDKTKDNSRSSRIEELTAYIDAYTGGMFTRALEGAKKI